MSPVIEGVAAGIGELVAIILKAPNPAVALERAKFYALADASKLAADAELRAELAGKK